jgi:hypothetical protein
VFDRKGTSSSASATGSALDAQDTSKPNGKIHRLNEDGTGPEDNPFVGQRRRCRPSTASATATRRADLNAATGVVWGGRARPARRRRAEHHPRRAQLRLAAHHLRHEPTARRGKGRSPRRPASTDHLLDAVHRRIVAGLLRRRQVPRWKGQILLGSLAFQELRRLELTGEKVTHRRCLQGRRPAARHDRRPDGYVIAFNQPRIGSPAFSDHRRRPAVHHELNSLTSTFERPGASARRRSSCRPVPYGRSAGRRGCASVSSSIARWRGLQAVCSVATVRARARRRPSRSCARALSAVAHRRSLARRACARRRPAAPRSTCSPSRGHAVV